MTRAPHDDPGYSRVKDRPAEAGLDGDRAAAVEAITVSPDPDAPDAR